MNRALTNAIKYWGYIAPLVKRPTNEKEFNRLVARLDQLLEIVGDKENHHLIGLVDILSNLITAYEEDHYKITKAKGVHVLKFLMDSHDLCQADLPEIASQGVLSEILNGKRSLNLRQIKLLAKRFHVDPSTFID